MGDSKPPGDSVGKKPNKSYWSHANRPKASKIRIVEGLAVVTRRRWIPLMRPAQITIFAFYP